MHFKDKSKCAHIQANSIYVLDQRNDMFLQNRETSADSFLILVSDLQLLAEKKRFCVDFLRMKLVHGAKQHQHLSPFFLLF